MTTDDVVNIVQALPTARAIGDDAYWQKAVPAILNPVLDEIASSYDFDFVMREYDDVVTVTSQAEYEVRGENNELRDIVSIRLGSSKKVLTRFRTLDADNYLSGGNTLGSVGAWYVFAVTNTGHPIVTLFDTPTTADVILYIRYRMKTPGIRIFPDSFSNVIALGVLAWLGGSLVFTGQNAMDSRHQGQFNAGFRYQQALKTMINRYRTGGADIDLAGVDPQITTANKLRSDINRVG